MVPGSLGVLAGHVESVGVVREIIRRLVVPRAGHVREIRGDGLDVLHECIADGAVVAVKVVGEVAAVDKKIGDAAAVRPRIVHLGTHEGEKLGGLLVADVAHGKDLERRAFGDLSRSSLGGEPEHLAPRIPGGVAHAVTVLGSRLEAGQGHRVHHAASPGLAPVLELTRLARLGLGEVRRGVRAGVGVVRSVLHDRTRGGGSAPRHSHLVVADAEREVRPGGNVVLEFAARHRERRRAERCEENRARGRPHRAFLVRGRAREVCATTPPGHKRESPSRTISKNMV